MNPRESEFEKEDKLGSGAFGTVWLVQQRSSGAQFALKEIDLRKPGMHQAMKEVETMTKLPPHRNVVRLYEHWMSKSGKDMWLLLEYCSQGTLAQSLMSSARLPDAALWNLSRQLLQALLLFERHRIVHNDIKPENIFIMEGFIPKIGDLGMARFTSVGSVLTRTPGGTPLFQAPEVLSKDTNIVGADGKPALFPEYAACEISYQADVYSLGAVIWSMVMCRNPDRPGGAFPLTPVLVPDSNLRELVNDMLQPDPAKRPRASHLMLRFPPAPDPNPDPTPTPPAPAPAPALLHFSSLAAHRDDVIVLSPDRLTVTAQRFDHKRYSAWVRCERGFPPGCGAVKWAVKINSGGDYMNSLGVVSDAFTSYKEIKGFGPSAASWFFTNDMMTVDRKSVVSGQNGDSTRFRPWFFNAGDVVTVELERRHGQDGVMRVRVAGRAPHRDMTGLPPDGMLYPAVCVEDSRQSYSMIPPP
jgi:serine/threonine protein kinase